MGWFQNKRLPGIFLVIFLAAFAISAINPPHPQDFILEHAMTVVFVIFIILTHKAFPLSNLSYCLIFVFIMLHTLGAHYTYSEVPYDAWAQWLFGTSITELFGFVRNHYDRLVHFSFGLLFAYPVREIFLRIASVRGIWGYYLPIDVMAAFSMTYEIIEWGVAIVFGGEMEATYLGSQGDIWDAQKDMALATLGGIITMVIVAIVNWHCKKNFVQEIISSLRIRRRMPLGEVELARYRKK